jgi:probable F420-dependent oxidoreductase
MPSVGLFVPTAAPDAWPNMALAFAQRAEAAGIRSLWVPDRPVFANPEPLTTLAAVAAATSTIQLGTCVLLGTLRPPALLAKSVATLDVLAGGRVILGLGVGSRADDFAAVEVPFAGRGARATELMQVLRLAWSGAPLRHAGRHYQIDVGPVGPRPAQPGGPPIWLGGSAEAALRRAGRLADGYIGSSSSGPAGVGRAWQAVRESAERAGRDPGALTFAVLVRAAVDDDTGRAMDRVVANARHYRPDLREDPGPAGILLGSPAACIERAHEYFAAGVEVLIVAPVTADRDHLDRLLSEVLTRL